MGHGAACAAVGHHCWRVGGLHGGAAGHELRQYRGRALCVWPVRCVNNIRAVESACRVSAPQVCGICPSNLLHAVSSMRSFQQYD